MSWKKMPDTDDETSYLSESSTAPLTRNNAAMAQEELEEEVFEDAKADEEDGVIETVDLQRAFEDCEIALKKFFSNDFNGAMEIMKPWEKSSLYHSLGTAIFEFIPAMLTFDRAMIQRALAAIKVCIRICNKNRKQYTFVQNIGSMIKKPNFAAFTDLEAHAELCYAEALLLQAALTVIEGEDLTGLIKGTFKVKSCYNSYQYCWDIKEQKKWDSDISKIHFKSGVRLGTATFNLMISLLPPKIVTLLEFVGFSGNKYYGLAELQKGSRSPGMRAILCDLTLLTYHLIICPFIGGEGDFDMAEKLLYKSLEEYPESVWFLSFKARLQFLQGMLEDATVSYNRAIHCQETYKQFRQVCYWELMWIHALNMEFRHSAAYAERLLESNAWSRTTYTYIQAAMLLETGDDIQPTELEIVKRLIRSAPSYKTRIAGKSLPMEKFVIKRCARYKKQGNRLVFPGFELLCIWNLIPLIANSRQLVQNILRAIESVRSDFETANNDWMAGYEADNMALILYMQGCCYAALDLPLLAVDRFQQVFTYRKELKEDTYLLPYTTVETAMCYYQLGQFEQTLAMLNDARKKFSGYSLESRLHFRIHARLEALKNLIGNTPLDPAPRVL